MMDLVKLCLDSGAHHAAQTETERLSFSETFLTLCEQNVCGRYGKNYTCPPHVGKISDLIRQIQAHKTAVMWQTIHDLEDSYDFEGMTRGKQLHNKITLEIAEKARELMVPDLLVLGAGGCFLCGRCAVQTQEPCRFPQRAISSLEAYGMNVSKVEETTGLKYINGANTVTYFSGMFF